MTATIERIRLMSEALKQQPEQNCKSCCGNCPLKKSQEDYKAPKQ